MMRPFILRSEMKPLSSAELARRDAVISQLTPEEIERITGATNCNDYVPNCWDPDGGLDLACDK